MLSAFKSTTRSLRHTTRFSSTLAEGNATDQLSNLGLQAVIASQQTPPVASTSKANLPVILNIPPAEDPLLQYLTSNIMKHGRRSKAARITSRTLLHLHSFTRSEPLPLLREAISAASPAVKCLSHRYGAKSVFKPIALGEKHRTRFAVKWILEASDSKPGKTLEERLAREVIAVLEGSSKALAKKAELHRVAMVNRYVSKLQALPVVKLFPEVT
jgi:small subunit ribosomal protein S7